MKKVLIISLMMFTLLFTMAASNYVPKVLTLHYDVVQKVYIGETFSLKSNSLYTYKSTNETIATYDEKNGIVNTIATGNVLIQKVNRETNNVVKTYALRVEDGPKEISVIGTNTLSIGEAFDFDASVYPSSASSEVVWTSSDEEILTVNEAGIATALKKGLVTLTATSKDYSDVYGKLYVMVNEPSEIEFTTVNKTIDSTNLPEVFETIGKKTESSVLMVTGYTINGEVKKEASVGCGIVYRRVANLKDGTSSEDTDINYDDVVSYEYYVVTNRHIVAKTTYDEQTEISTTTNYDYIGLYYGGANEIGARIIAYDEKIDLAVITFTSTMYFPIAKFGTSENVQAGEFIVSVGTAEGKEYFRTISFGIVSHPQRYVSDDTDGDGTNDWDAEYIQHDAPINGADCGSPIVNMKGEVIGINTTKKIETSSGIKAENLSFAIPIDLVKTLVVKLEKGEVIKRPLLGVSILDVKDILANEEAFRLPGYATEDGITLPSGIDHGFYVAEITEGGVASKAGIMIGDIIVNFNDVEVYYSYQLRAQLGNFIIDSGESTKIIVYRGNQYVTLEVTF